MIFALVFPYHIYAFNKEEAPIPNKGCETSFRSFVVRSNVQCYLYFQKSTRSQVTGGKKKLIFHLIGSDGWLMLPNPTSTK